MKNNKAVRQSNFELLRIISMFSIVLLHIGTHGLNNYIDISTHLDGSVEIIYYVLRSLAVIAVNVYVLISGYFLSKSTFKISKLVKLFFEISFFSTIIYLMSVSFGLLDFNLLGILKSLFSIFFGEYWFASIYFALYALSPFLNILIDNLGKQKYTYLVIVLFILICGWQVLVPTLNIGNGISLLYFIFLYLISAYVRKYPLAFRQVNKNVYLFSYFVIALTNGLWTFFLNEYFGGFGSSIGFVFNSPGIVVMSVSLFLYFDEVKFYSPKINYFSKYVFGIYLIHEHSFLRGFIWKEIGVIESVITTNDFTFILKTVGYSIIIFFVCWIGSWILSTIYNLLFNSISAFFKKQSFRKN